jgi:SWIM zinc finger
MAIQQTSYTKYQHERAERLADMIPTLPTATDKRTGIVYTIFPSSDDPEHTGHGATHLWCSCKGFERRSACSHQLAVLRHIQRAEAVRFDQAAQKRRENGVCRQPGCILTATTKLGRCEQHTRAILSLVADL